MIFCVYFLLVALAANMFCNHGDSIQAAIAYTQPNISCSVVHGEDKKIFSWNHNQTYHIDVILYEHAWKTFIKCFGDDTRAVKYEIKVVNAVSNNSLESETVLSATSNTSDAVLFSFEKQFIEMNEGTNIPFIMNIIESNTTWLLLQGNFSRLAKLPSFSQVPLNQSFLESAYNRTSWQFKPYSCNPKLVIVLPANLSNFKNGFPLGFAFTANQLTMLKWENITLKDDDYEMLVTIQNSSLLLHSETQLSIIPSIAESTSPVSIVQVFKKNELSSLQISKILSTSSSHGCNTNNHVSWFDVLTLVQLSNESIIVLIGSSWNQLQDWKAYSLPAWLSLVTYIETQIDFDRHSFFLAANIGMPERTIVLVYDLADSERKELKLTSTPFFLNHALEKPKLKLLAKVPAALLYDQSEIWLSTDAGHNFRQIFGVQRDEKILKIETATDFQKELVIITTSNVFRYSSFGLRRQLINSDLHCLATSQSVFIAYGNEKFTFFCSDSVFGMPNSPKIVKFDTEMSLISSLSSSIVNDFEMKVSMPDVYSNVHDIILSMNNFCEISKFPIIHLCNAKREQSQTHTLKPHPEMQYYPNCTYKLKNYNNSIYIMTAAPNQEGQSCKLWTASMIGRSVILLKARASCWVKWLLNDTIAIVNCSDYNLKEEEEFFSSSDIAIVDSRGGERCQKSSSQVYMTNSLGMLEINSTSSSFYDQVIDSGAIYVRLDNAVGKLSSHENRTFFALLGNVTLKKLSFTYVCFITDHDSDDKNKLLFKNSLKPCHFDVAYQGLQSADVFLDANDETEFNLTLSKILSEHPYLDQIPPFAIQPIEPTYVKVQVKSHMKLTPMTVEVLIKQKPYSNGTSLLSIYATTQPAHCTGSHKLITIHGTCPPSKHLTFEYPLVYDRDTWLYGNPNDHEGFTRLATIPFNYQPPSILGKAIPLTPNIYNADPSKPMHRASYKISRNIAKYKQCQGKKSRASCGCTLDATISSRPDETDCIQRVFKVYFMEEFTPKLFVVDRDGTRTDLKFPYCITELNERKDYSIENKVRPGCMSAAKKSALKFDGSGLFHFRVDVIKSGYTFCDLQTYFIIFVADAPMPYPAQELVRAMTSFCFGSIILCVFLINFHLK